MPLLMLVAIVILFLGKFFISTTIWLTTILTGAALFFQIKYVNYRLGQHKRFKILGVPGPTPNLFFGNVKEIQDIGFSAALEKWYKAYGKTFRFFEGGKVVLVTSDVDIIKQVMIKEFSSFHSRKIRPVSPLKNSVFGAVGKDWKRLRMISSPTFSAKKMKEMSPMIHKLVHSLMGVFDNRVKAGYTFDILSDFQRLTISIIGSCGFGLDIDATKNPDDIFLRKCREKFYSPNKWRRLRVLLMSAVPSAGRFLNIFRSKSENPTKWLLDASGAIIELRKKSPIKQNDFVQLMLNAEQVEEPKDVTELEISVEDDGKETVEVKKAGTTGKGKGMTIKEMQSQCLAFLVAGFETTTSALTFAAYELALHPDIQKKLQLEIDEYMSGDTLPDFYTVQKMSYLDMVFSEALRLHTVGMRITSRLCNRDCVVSGIPLKVGDTVQFHTKMVHMDPELWGPEDPKEFVPERFLPDRKSKRNPMAWLPFGGGPRNCIGMRFGLMEAKLCLAAMLKRFNVVRTEETKVPLVLSKQGTSRPIEGVWVRLENRH